MVIVEIQAFGPGFSPQGFARRLGLQGRRPGESHGQGVGQGPGEGLGEGPG